MHGLDPVISGRLQIVYKNFKNENRGSSPLTHGSKQGEKKARTRLLLVLEPNLMNQ